MPETTPDTTPQPAGAPDLPDVGRSGNPQKLSRQRCRSLTIRGVQCRQRALRGGDLCVQHARNRYPVCPSGPHVTIPLLEDLDTIQLVATQVAQGLFAEALDPSRAGKILYACQVAAMTIARPSRLRPSEKEPEPLEPVTETFQGPNGEPLGPVEILPQELSPKMAKFAGPPVVWSWDKYLYRQECKRLGKPVPESDADLPESGMVTEEELGPEIESKSDMENDYRDRLLELRLEADRRGALPPLDQRPCIYRGGRFCRGPATKSPYGPACAWCARERDEHLRMRPDALDLAPDLNDLKACAEEAAPSREPGQSPLLSTLSTPPNPTPPTPGVVAPVMGGAHPCLGPVTYDGYLFLSPRVCNLIRRKANGSGIYSATRRRRRANLLPRRHPASRRNLRDRILCPGHEFRFDHLQLRQQSKTADPHGS